MGKLAAKLYRNTMKGCTLTCALKGIRLPAPFSQLSQGWTYRAWVDDNKVVITHAIGNQRLIRVNWVNESRSVLYSTVILELKDEVSGVFNEAARCNQQAISERYVSQL